MSSGIGKEIIGGDSSGDGGGGVGCGGGYDVIQVHSIVQNKRSRSGGGVCTCWD